MKGYEIFREALRELKLGPVFGNPGSTEIPMLRGVDDYILTLHDSLAVGMADGYAQFSGRPALVNLHAMPGVANSMAFIHTARQNHSPVIITAGQQDTRHAYYEPLLWHDLQSLVGDAAKYSYEVKSAEDIEKAMKRAYSISLEPPMGPVFLSFPMDVMDLEADYNRAGYSVPNTSLVDSDAVEYVLRCISESRSPAVIMGGELDEYGMLDKAEHFANRFGCQVFAEPFASRAPFRSSNERFSGDLAPATSSINMSLLSHDLILNFGGDLTMYPYLPSRLLPGKKIITVSLSPSYRHGEYITSNPGLFMEALENRVGKIGNYRRESDLSGRSAAAREKKSMGASYVIAKARNSFSRHVIVDEAISSSPLVRSTMGYRDKSYFTAKSGQLGWGLPAAAGISLHSPKVLEIVGDGALMYTIQTLWTISHYNLPVKILVLNNEGYTILKSFSRSFYPGVENAPYFTFRNDISSISESFGVPSRIADKDLRELDWLAEGSGPKLLVANVSKDIPALFP
ncbi:benzoylformate decarboxylase [uncultured archaeon]|nr:benzoylformate decarboxylase [uncultured archaeon]